MGRAKKTSARGIRKSASLAEAIEALERVRAPLFLELDELLKDPGSLKGEPAHLSCTRRWNQMRISPLEVLAIAEALGARPELMKELPAIRRRLRAELRRLRDSTARQNFRCPLLSGTKCLVHVAAKPIGCLAWNQGREFTDAAWYAFERRDALNDALFGRRWRLRAIPLWLARAMGERLPVPAEGKRKSTALGRRGRGAGRRARGRASSGPARSR